jgi:hypothetical protein
MNSVEISAVVDEMKKQFGNSPVVIDVTTGNRFGEDVVVLTVPTQIEREALGESVPGYFEGVRIEVIPMFGIGSFTRDSSDTRRFTALIYTPPYNVYGTPENKEMDALAAKILLREREAWASMSDEAREKAIADEVVSRRKNGWHAFGNCMPE